MSKLRSNASLKAVAEHAALKARRAHRRLRMEWQRIADAKVYGHYNTTNDDSTRLYREWKTLEEIALHVARHAGVEVKTENTSPLPHPAGV